MRLTVIHILQGNPTRLVDLGYCSSGIFSLIFRLNSFCRICSNSARLSGPFNSMAILFVARYTLSKLRTVCGDCSSCSPHGAESISAFGHILIPASSRAHGSLPMPVPAHPDAWVWRDKSREPGVQILAVDLHSKPTRDLHRQLTRRLTLRFLIR